MKHDVSKANDDPEHIVWPDYREDSREDMIHAINEFMQDTKRHQFFSDCIDEHRPKWLQHMITISSLFMTDRMCIDGEVIRLVEKESE